jgi:hypothetical protein
MSDRYYVSAAFWLVLSVLRIKQSRLCEETGATRQYITKLRADPRRTVSRAFALAACRLTGLAIEEFFLPAPSLAARRRVTQEELLIA